MFVGRRERRRRTNRERIGNAIHPKRNRLNYLSIFICLYLFNKFFINNNIITTDRYDNIFIFAISNINSRSSI